MYGAEIYTTFFDDICIGYHPCSATTATGTLPRIFREYSLAIILFQCIADSILQVAEPLTDIKAIENDRKNFCAAKLIGTEINSQFAVLIYVVLKIAEGPFNIGG